MSINHILTPDLNIDCKSLKINGVPIINTSGKYDAVITSNNVGMNFLNGFFYWQKIGDQMRISCSRTIKVKN